MYGLLWPTGRLTDIQSAPHAGREADGISVPVVGSIPIGPITYDQATQHAIPWTAEIARLAAEAAATELDLSRLVEAVAQALADLQQIKGAQSLTDAQKTAAIKRLAEIQYRVLRHLAQQAGATVPVEQ